MAKFNVVKEYDWTTIPRGSGLRKKAPKIHVRSYKIKSNEALNRLKSYMEVAEKTDPKTFYDKLYGEIASPEDDFNLPFFNDTLRSFTNTYGDTFQAGFMGNMDSAMSGAVGELGALGTSFGGSNIKNLGSNIMNGMKSGYGDDADRSPLSIEQAMAGPKALLGGMKGAMKNIQGTNPGSYIETPKLYQYEQNDSGLEVSFVLSNTINSDYKKNNELVKKLTTINRPKRINSIAMEPPRIYQVKIPGQRLIRWASCSSFSVGMLGTKRELEGVLTPEAYQISMTFTSLTTEVSNFMDDV